MKRIAVILPIYNGARVVEDVFGAVHDFARRNRGYRFLFVDDGSVDNTAELLQRRIAAEDNGSISLLSYSVNQGKGYAVKTAVERSDADFIVFTDGDLAYSLDHLPVVVKALEDYDVVAGSRSLAEEEAQDLPVIRRFMGWTFNFMVRLMLSMPYRDTQAGLKGFRREAADRIFSKQLVHDFSFDVELIYLARLYGYRVGEVPARVSDDHSYKRSTVRLLQDPFKMLLSLLRIRCNSLVGKYG